MLLQQLGRPADPNLRTDAGATAACLRAVVPSNRPNQREFTGTLVELRQRLGEAHAGMPGARVAIGLRTFNGAFGFG
jgi:hypothetical protein